MFAKEVLASVLLEESKSLGNRKKYVGSSDVTQCFRKVVKSKQEAPKFNDEQMMVMLRGHLVEKIVERMVKKISKYYIYQYEISHPKKDYIRAHIDFLVEGSIIIEVKSVSQMPESPYPTWVEQIIFQAGILKLNNIEISKLIVLAIDVTTGEMKEFEVEYNESIFNCLLEKAEKLWYLINSNNNDLPTEPSLLCAYCPFKRNCPSFSGDEVPEYVKSAVLKYNSIMNIEKDLKREKENLKEKVISYLGEGTFKIDGTKVSIKRTVSNRFDTTSFRKDYEGLYKKYLKEVEYLSFKVF